MLRAAPRLQGVAGKPLQPSAAAQGIRRPPPHCPPAAAAHRRSPRTSHYPTDSNLTTTATEQAPGRVGSPCTAAALRERAAVARQPHRLACALHIQAIQPTPRTCHGQYPPPPPGILLCCLSGAMNQLQPPATCTLQTLHASQVWRPLVHHPIVFRLPFFLPLLQVAVHSIHPALVS